MEINLQDIGKALLVLLEEAQKRQESEIEQEIVLLQAKHEDLRREIRQDTIKREDANTEKSKLRVAISELAQKIGISISSGEKTTPKKSISLEELAKENNVEIPPEKPIETPATSKKRDIPHFLGREKELVELDHFLKNPEKRIFGLFGAPMIGKTELVRHFLKTNQEAQEKYKIQKVTFQNPKNPNEMIEKIMVEGWEKAESTLFVIENFEEALEWKAGRKTHHIKGDFLELKEFLREIYDENSPHKLLIESRFRFNVSTIGIDYQDFELEGVESELFWQYYEANDISRTNFDLICKKFSHHTWLLRLGCQDSSFGFYCQKKAQKMPDHQEKISAELWYLLEEEILNKLEDAEIAILAALVLKSPLNEPELDKNVAQKTPYFKPYLLKDYIFSLEVKILLGGEYEINPFLRQVCFDFMKTYQREIFSKIANLPFFQQEPHPQYSNAYQELAKGDYRKFYQSIRNLRKEGNYTEVFEILDYAYEHDQEINKAGVLNEMGITYKWLKDFPKAKEVLEKACELGNLHSFNELAIIYKEEKDFVKAKEVLEKACELGNIHSFNELAMIYKEEKDFVKAKETLEKACELGNIHSFNELAMIYKEEKDFENARKILKKALKIEPENVKVLNELAIIYKEEKDFVKAKEVLEKACELGNLHSFNELAIIYKEEKNIPKAKEVLEKACELGNIHSFNELAIIYKEEKNFPKAKEVLEKALGIEPENVKVLNELAIIYKEEKNFPKAKEVLEKACKLGNIHSFNELAIIYKEEGDLDKALETVEKGLKIAPKDTYLLRTKDRILKARENGGLSEVLKALEQADYAKYFEEMDKRQEKMDMQQKNLLASLRNTFLYETITAVFVQKATVLAREVLKKG